LIHFYKRSFAVRVIKILNGFSAKFIKQIVKLHPSL